MVFAQYRSQASDAGTGSPSARATGAAPSLPSPPPLVGTCSGPEVAACLAHYSKPQMNAEDIQRLLDFELEDCFALTDPEKLWNQGGCLPLTVGRDARNGQTIELVFFAAIYALPTVKLSCATRVSRRNSVVAWEA